MPKYNSLSDYVKTFNSDAKRCYQDLKDIIQSIDLEVKVRLFAGQVAFYDERTLKRTFHSSPVIIMAFHKDHVNVFATANVEYKEAYTENLHICI